MSFPTIGTLDVWVYLQVLARVSALIAIAPVFGAREVPAPVKVGLAVILSFVLAPIASPSLRAAGVPDSLYGIASPLVAHIVIGLLLGFVVSLIIMAVEMAGALIDTQVGFSMAQMFNPAISELAGPFTQFQSMYALLLFLLAHGHYILIVALARSFINLPALAVDLNHASYLNFVSDITFNTLVNGLKIAAPPGAILLVVDFSFAMLARAVPQMNVFFVGMPLKALIGLMLIVVVLPLLAAMVGQMVSGLPFDLSRTMQGMHTP
ncbi:MAG: flagellar biosynthetic protein FliR [Capsulimonadaceae bacterium]|nr:flagellar biosynthetic protein FliR [Capsulimonadaceae bacterium]